MPEQTPQHYFSAQPASEFASREIEVRLAHQDFTVETAGGIFSPEHIDAGTEALLYSVPLPNPAGNLLDIGCGWGPLALTMGLEAPEAAVYAIDVNERALELTTRNAARLGLANIAATTPDALDTALTFTTIWSNPPIRVGKDELHVIMRTWLPRLVIGGEAYLVAAKHLGADSFEKWLGTEFAGTHAVTREDTRKGFRVIKVTRT
jgi:16S rRNA (guanine1207-N2)-methyltransferase